MKAVYNVVEGAPVGNKNAAGAHKTKSIGIAVVGKYGGFADVSHAGKIERRTYGLPGKKAARAVKRIEGVAKRNPDKYRFGKTTQKSGMVSAWITRK